MLPRQVLTRWWLWPQQVDTKVSQQTYISKEKVKRNIGKYCPKEIKSRAEDTNGYIRIDEEEDASACRAREIEHKERKDRETNFIIKGI